MNADEETEEVAVTDDIDLVADLNAQDDDGLGWSTLGDAHAPDRIVARAMVLAGNRYGQAVAIGPVLLGELHAHAGGYRAGYLAALLLLRRTARHLAPGTLPR